MGERRRSRCRAGVRAVASAGGVRVPKQKHTDYSRWVEMSLRVVVWAQLGNWVNVSGPLFMRPGRTLDFDQSEIRKGLQTSPLHFLFISVNLAGGSERVRSSETGPAPTGQMAMALASDVPFWWCLLTGRRMSTRRVGIQEEDEDAAKRFLGRITIRDLA
jgi:hypothetical protein